MSIEINLQPCCYDCEHADLHGYECINWDDVMKTSFVVECSHHKVCKNWREEDGE